MKPLVAFLLLLVSLNIQAQTITQAEIINQFNAHGNREHPRLLFTDKELTRIKTLISHDADMKRWHKLLILRADTLLTEPVKVGRNMSTDIPTLALAHLTSPKDAYKQRIEQMLNKAFALNNWGNAFKLDASSRLIGVAIAYDWLHQEWSAQQKAWIKENIKQFGFNLYQQSVANNIWWLGENYKGGSGYFNNHNAVCNTGPVLAALALIDDAQYQQEASGIISTAFNSMQVTLKGLLPDGAWDEGPGYYGYALSHLVDSLASLENTLATDFDYLKHPGLQATPNYLLHINGPSGSFNYADGLTRRQLAPYLYWLGERLPNSDFAHHYYQQSKVANHLGKAQSLIYFNPRFSEPKPALPLDARFGRTEIATLRSSWNHDALYLAMKGGKGSMSHGNSDVGQVVFQSDGVQWLVDLGAEPYSRRFFQYETTRYHYYRAKPEGHNTLVINPDSEYQQDIKPFSRLSQFDSQADRAFATLDMSPAYQRQKAQAQRSVALTNQRRSAVIQDSIKLAAPGEIYSFWHTYAQIQISQDGQQATLQQNGQTLTLLLVQPKGQTLRFDTMTATALPQSRDPEGAIYHHQNIQKLVLHAKEVTKLDYALLLIPGEHRPSKSIELIPLDNWQQGSNGLYALDLPRPTAVKAQQSNADNIDLTNAKIRFNDMANQQPNLAVLFDGNPYTYLSTKAENKSHSKFLAATIEVELAEPTMVHGVKQQWVTGFQRSNRFRIFSSVDGKDWKQQFNGTSQLTDELYQQPFAAPQPAKWIKMEFLGDVKSRSKLAELRVY